MAYPSCPPAWDRILIDLRKARDQVIQVDRVRQGGVNNIVGARAADGRKRWEGRQPLLFTR